MTTVGPAPVYTGNNVLIQIKGKIIALVETLHVTRSVNRRPVHQVGTPLFADAPTTSASVNVSATNLVPMQGKSNSAPSFAAQGLVPSGSLANEVYADSYDMQILSADSGQVEFYIQDAYYNDDAIQVPGTDVLTYNCTWVARDSMFWQ